MLTKPDVIIEQFCAQGTVGVDYVIPAQSSINPDVITQDQGIPISMQTPLIAGGVPVDRPQTNGYMYLYSWILAWIQFGGTFTFEATVSTANGGYPAGTVLWAASVKNFVVSLMNNNTSNFVTTPGFINDGVHWSTLTFSAYPDITDAAGLVSIIGSGGLNVINGLTKNGVPVVTNTTLNNASLAGNFASLAVASVPVVTTTTINNNTLNGDFVNLKRGSTDVVTIDQFSGNLSSYIKIPNFSPAGTAIIQFGVFSAATQIVDAVAALPIAFPTAFVGIVVSKGSNISATSEYTIGAQPLSLSTFAYTNSNASPGAQTAQYVAIGY